MAAPTFWCAICKAERSIVAAEEGRGIVLGLEGALWIVRLSCGHVQTAIDRPRQLQSGCDETAHYRAGGAP